MRVRVGSSIIFFLALCIAGCAAPSTPSAPRPRDQQVFGYVQTNQQQSQPETKPPRVDRSRFAQLMSQVQPGMTQAQVVQLLGEADEIRPAGSVQHIRPDGLDRVLCYGVTRAAGGADALPTLGQIYIDRGGRVQYAFGGGEAVDASTIDEAALRSLLVRLHALPPLEGLHYDPRPVIRAANSLQPLGKDAALAVIEEYLRVTPHWPVGPRQGVFALLRVLFDPIPGAPMPPVRVGEPSPPPPVNVAAAPRFPVLIHDDVPLLLVGGYASGGMVEPVETHVAFFRQHGQIRSKPLRPTDEPMKLVDAVLAAPAAAVFDHARQSWDQERAKAMLANQVLWLVDNGYPTPLVRGLKFDWCCNNADSLWARHQQSAPAMTWAAPAQAYVPAAKAQGSR